MRTPPRLAIAASVLATACLTTATNPIDASAAAPRAESAQRLVKAPSKVLVFVEENHSLAQMKAGMPYLNRLATKRFGYALNYLAITHPSLPNYLAMAGGSTFGVTDDGAPAVNGAKVGRARSVFDEAIARGYTAKTYAESMPSNCYAHTTGKYAVKHNPWPYFSAGRRNCARYDVPMGTARHGALAHDIRTGHLPNVGMAIPNICHDAHSCSLSTADHWLRRWLPQIFHSRAFRSGRLTVVVTADEGNDSGVNSVLTVVMHRPGALGRLVHTRLSHYSLSKFMSAITGSRALHHARHAHGLGRAFGL